MSDNLENLGQKLDEIRARDSAERGKQERQQKDAENMGVGMRAGAELVGAIVAGGFIGWTLDGWFDSKPAFLIVMLLLGVITGFFNVWRTTQNISISAGFSGLHPHEKDAKTLPENEDGA